MLSIETATKIVLEGQPGFDDAVRYCFYDGLVGVLFASLLLCIVAGVVVWMVVDVRRETPKFDTPDRIIWGAACGLASVVAIGIMACGLPIVLNPAGYLIVKSLSHQ